VLFRSRKRLYLSTAIKIEINDEVNRATIDSYNGPTTLLREDTPFSLKVSMAK